MDKLSGIDDNFPLNNNETHVSDCFIIRPIRFDVRFVQHATRTLLKLADTV